MSSPIAERLRDAVSQAHWNEAVALLQTSAALQAAEALGDLPFEQQQSLFRHLPLGLAAAVVAQFPYYHEYVLLHSLPAGEMRALVDKMNPDDRMRFFDELPEEAWQRLMDELSSSCRVEEKDSVSWTLAHAPGTHREIDFEARQVKGPHGQVHLTAKEFELPFYLAPHPKKAVSHRELLHAV